MSIQLSDLLQNLYGVKSFSQINKATSLVQDTVTSIMSANPNRLSFLVVNTSTANIYLSSQNDVSSTKGIYLAPLGGSIIIQWDRDFELVASQWFAIASNADSEIYILENISV
jgi:hypothetical protein